MSELTLAENAVVDVRSTVASPDRKPKASFVAFLMVIVAFVVYNTNGRLVSAGDNYPARYLPFSIIKHRTLKLDPIADVVAQGETHPHWCINKNGHTYSFYPITAPVLVTPLYIPAVAYLEWKGWTEPRLDQVARLMEKLISALIASLSVGLMYLLLVRRTNCRWPLLLTIAYGFGTNTWMISGQALWQHGLAELLIVVALYLVLGDRSRKRALMLGFCLALVAAIRPPDVLLAAPIGIFALRWAGRDVWFLLVSSAIPLGLLCMYNLKVANHIAGGYTTYHGLDAISYSLPVGLAGLLFSPARGLFVFSPFLLFLPWLLPSTLRDHRVRPLALLILVGIVVQLGLYAKLDWRAGCSWGPRWLTDMLPLLVWLMAAGIGTLRPLGLVIFLVAVGFSIGVQTVGAFWYTGASDEVIMQHGGDPNRLPEVWDVSITPYLAEIRHSLAPRELFLDSQAFVDRICVDGVDVESILPETELEFFGWAIADRRTPNAVRIMISPVGKTPWSRSRTYPTVVLNAFGERPDVNHTMQSQGPSGWQVIMSTKGLDPGLHRVEVKVQGNAGGEFRHVAHRYFEVLPVGLESGVQVVSHRLRRHQQDDGYWLTTYTSSTRFNQPTPEMNIFLTAMIYDLLTPVSNKAGFEPVLERARNHLRSQIESNGLVRYHGRTDSATIHTLGRLITPDADDTALAWRIAGQTDDPRLADVLNLLKRYRDPGGLYRTWLAQQKDFISIDLGKNPNPADIAIQMHILMFLAEVDLIAAQSLHAALKAVMTEDQHWVYYHQAPLIPIWRAAELKKRGYAVEVPTSRMRTDVPGQEIWVQACHLLSQYTATGAPSPLGVETRALLEALAKDDFATIRRNPPLMYHNDLTAKCSRYYWSVDFGYALWLRLYFEMTANSAIPEKHGVKQ